MKKTWWKESVIYQIYPRSFNDTNGDGIGDLQGIIDKVDYLADLGVDVIWLCPIYDSPNDDNGYDIRDYRAIHPEFGTLEQFEELLEKLHARGLKLIMDLVVNHTSDEHAWFAESRKSKDNPYRDYYFWKPAKNGGSPTNWPSFFGGNVWEFDQQSQEYYLHIFSKKQPDLNWENPQVRKEVSDIITYWLDKGIDGFRMDVVPLISKRLEFEDTPYPRFNDTVEHVYSNGPRVHEYIHGLHEEVFKHYDIMTVGEGPGISTEVALDYVGEKRKELNLIFHLDHMFLGYGLEGRFDPIPYNLQDVIRIFNDWDSAMGEEGWISIFLDNHDFPRMVSRFGHDGKYREKSAKLLAILLLSLRGTPCIYQGTEIGMTNVTYDKLSDFDDVETHNFYQVWKEKGFSDEEFIALANRYGRDNARTPMQWSSEKYAGFTSGIPWIKVNPNYNDINVQSALHDPQSILSFYKQMLTFRKQNKTLTYGKYQHMVSDNPNIYAYRRWDGEGDFLVILNFGDEQVHHGIDNSGYSLVKSNDEDYSAHVLNAWQGVVLRKE